MPGNLHLVHDLLLILILCVDLLRERDYWFLVLLSPSPFVVTSRTKEHSLIRIVSVVGRLCVL